MWRRKKQNFPFFNGNGETAALLQTLDWSASSLGPPDTWPVALRVLVKHILDSKFPMWVAWGPDLNVIYNDAFPVIIGDKHPSAFGGRLQDIWSEIWNKLEPIAMQTLAGKSSYFERATYHIVRHGKVEEAWFTYSWTPARSDDGEIAGIFCVLKEVTAQVAAERALQTLNEKLEQEIALKTFERNQAWLNSQDLLLVAGFDGIFRDVNPAWTSMLGYEHYELVGTHFLKHTHPDDAQTMLRAHQQAVEMPVPCVEARYRHRDGSYRWLSWQSTPSNGAIYASARDITKEKEQAEALHRTEDALRHAQKMEAVGQLTGGIAHDFNNLLAGVIGNLEMMRIRISQGNVSDISRHIDGAMAASERAAMLTHRLLAFSRHQALAPKVVNVNELIVSMLDMFNSTVGPGIQLRPFLEDQAWNVRCDPHQLENALLNLAINARDAMPGGGELVIETANAYVDEQLSKELEELAPGDYVLISVTDTGCGMSPEIISRVFDPFFTTKPLGKGTGLGLSMVFGFVKQSKGHVQIESRLHQGTAIRLYLPMHDGAPQPEKKSEESLAPVPNAAHQTILLVDDEIALRNLLAEKLSEFGYTVMQAYDAGQALKLLESTQVDLLVCDVGLPGNMNGQQLASAAREAYMDLPILFITGYAETDALGTPLLEYKVDVLMKPFPLDEFASKVHDAIAG